MSGDQNEASYNEYFATMPWVSDGYDKPAYSTKMTEFGLRGIPSLCLLKKDGTLASSNCRADVSGNAKPSEVIEKWAKLV